jgi:RNA polymerase sigma factor (sigma-70 family)
MIASVDTIVQLLTKNPGLKAKEMAKILKVKKKVVNTILYHGLDIRFTKDDSHCWYLIISKPEAATNEIQVAQQDSSEAIYLNNLDQEDFQEESEQSDLLGNKEAWDSDEIENIDHPEEDTNDLSSEYYSKYSLPYPTAKEERSLWEKYLKWRYVEHLVGSEGISNDIDNACWTILTQAAREISHSQPLIELLRRVSGLDNLGDIMMDENASDTRDMIELYRLIQYSKKRTDENANTVRSQCCLEDLFGYHLGQILSNIVFGRGNPNLVNKIVAAVNESREEIKNKLLDLAINRELLPRSLLDIINPNTPLQRIIDELEGIDAVLISQSVMEGYKEFILNIRSSGLNAFNRIIESHLRLVFRIAKKRVEQRNSLPFDDLIQEGSMGLLRAAEKYNPTHDTRFMSYAPWWINQAIYRAIDDQSRTIRIPVHMLESINRLSQATKRLTQEFGREPTYTEIAQEMEISSDKVREIIKVSQSPIPLESSLGEEGYPILGNSIQDRDSLPLDDIASKQLLKDQIEDVLHTLTPREQRILQLRFGLEDGRSRTLEEVGVEFNVTRERIRQIEAKALRKLRHPSRSRKLRDFLDDPAAYKRKEEKSEDISPETNDESEPIDDSNDNVQKDANDYE